TIRQYILGVLNNNLSQAPNAHSHVGYQRPRGGSKKFVQQGRSHFCAQSVLPVREHGKMARTPLAAFFNSPFLDRRFMEGLGGG
ncbi:MAG: hypothetical protein KC588_18750, partial [Nitrospira sp.]|nr:hypothetical protein [Nitrospira sp.]